MFIKYYYLIEISRQKYKQLDTKKKDIVSVKLNSDKTRPESITFMIIFFLRKGNYVYTDMHFKIPALTVTSFPFLNRFLKVPCRVSNLLIWISPIITRRDGDFLGFELSRFCIVICMISFFHSFFLVISVSAIP